MKLELQNEEYRKALEELMMKVHIGKNLHEDSADGLVQLIQLIDGGSTGKCEVMDKRSW